jgi:prepilin-type N-terminal cleavage/methylation domain-containing protein
VNRRGLTLTELLITLVVFGVLGTALARLMIGNSRYVSRQDTLLEARQTARAAMNVMLPELRMVSDGGLVAASADSVTVRVPYAFGVFCRNEYAVLLPPDSMVYAAAVPGGVAYQLATGAYAFDSTVTVAGTTTQTAPCDQDSIRALPGGVRITFSVSGLAPATRLFYLYQKVTYKFAASAALPGRRALWRRVGGSVEELLAPFDPSARFAFLVGSRLTPQTTVPASLSDIQGLEVRLVGHSVGTVQGTAAPAAYYLYPRIRFGNKLPP